MRQTPLIIISGIQMLIEVWLIQPLSFLKGSYCFLPEKRNKKNYKFFYIQGVLSLTADSWPTEQGNQDGGKSYLPVLDLSPHLGVTGMTKIDKSLTVIR